VIRLVVLMYVKYPLSLRNVEDLLAEHGIDICLEAARLDSSGESSPSGSLPPPAVCRRIAGTPLTFN
jgi:hypothetical protein